MYMYVYMYIYIYSDNTCIYISLSICIYMYIYILILYTHTRLVSTIVMFIVCFVAVISIIDSSDCVPPAWATRLHVYIINTNSTNIVIIQ